MARKKFETALLITGDSRGAVKATKLTDKSLEKLEKRQLKGQKVSRQYASSIGNITRNLAAYTGVAAAAASIVLFPSHALTRAKEFEKQLIGIGKTTGITGDDLAGLGADIDALSAKIPVSVDRLNQLAESAGQLGVKGAENIATFAGVMGMMERATDIAGEAGAKSIARVLNVTGEGIDQVKNFGSVLVALGQDAAAGESEILRITNEVARATAQFDIGAAQAAAMGAAMSSMGIRAESGGSAMGRTFQTITNIVQAGGEELDKFGEKFGFAGDEFAKLFAEDKIAAMNMFLGGLADQGEAAGAALDSIGLGGQEIAKVLPTMALNLDKYIEAQALANKEMANATALDKEFEASLESLDAQWVLFKNNMDSVARSMASDYLPALTDIFRSINNFMSGGGLGDLKIQLQATAEQMDRTWGEPARKLLTGFTETYERQMIALQSFTRVTVNFIEDAFRNMPQNIATSMKILGVEAGALIDRATSGFANRAAGFKARSNLLEQARALFEERGTPKNIQNEILDQINNMDTGALGELVRTQEQISQDRIAALNNIFNERQAEQEEFQRRMAEIRANASADAAEHSDVLQKITVDAKRLNAEVSTNVALTDDQSDELDNLRDSLFPVEKLAREYRENQELLNKALDAGDISAKEHAKAMAGLSENFDQAKDRALGLTDQADPLAREWERAIDRIDDAFFNLFRSAFDGFDEFKDEMVNAAKDLAAQMALQFAKQQFGFSAGNFAASFGGGGGAGGTTGTTASNLGLASSLASSSAGGKLIGMLGIDSMTNVFGQNLGSVGGTGILGEIGSTFGFNQATTPAVSAGAGFDMGGTIVDSSGTPFGSGTGGFSAGQFAASAGAGIAGGFAGHAIGENLFGKEPRSGVGAASGAIIGAKIGSAWPVIGTAIGALIGGLLDAAFGKDHRDPRFRIAATTSETLTADMGRNENIGKSEVIARDDLAKIATSAFGSVHFQTNKDALPNQGDARQVAQALDAFAQVENAIASQLDPGQIDDISQKLLQQEELFKKKSLDFTPFIAERFGTIFDEIGGEVDAAFDRLTRGLSNEELVKSIDVIANSAFRLSGVQDLLDLDVINETTDALEHLDEQVQRTLLDRYNETIDHLQEVAAEFDHSHESIAALTDALRTQKQVAAQLAVAYQRVGEQAATTFDQAIKSIEESVLSDEQIFARRRDEISQLMEDLKTASDPARIGQLAQNITQTAASAFGLLDGGQQEALAPEFVDFLNFAKEAAAARVDVGLESLADREEGLADLVNLEVQAASDNFASAANQFDSSVDRFEQLIAAQQRGEVSFQAIAQTLDEIRNNTGNTQSTLEDVRDNTSRQRDDIREGIRDGLAFSSPYAQLNM